MATVLVLLLVAALGAGQVTSASRPERSLLQATKPTAPTATSSKPNTTTIPPCREVTLAELGARQPCLAQRVRTNITDWKSVKLIANPSSIVEIMAVGDVACLRLGQAAMDPFKSKWGGKSGPCFSGDPKYASGPTWTKLVCCPTPPNSLARLGGTGFQNLNAEETALARIQVRPEADIMLARAQVEADTEKGDLAP